MIKRMIRNLRNEVRPNELSTRLWNMSKGYSRWDREKLKRVAVAMRWEIQNYTETGRVTDG
ncbi:hypothetical protein PBI_CHIDIEBERE_107 [Gordonia phage Chidiebere]|uniref:Uncharacterized protein n=1 Tax=Gordonia phage Chidiebere TaxID=2656530 RepID=A0A649VLD3_9CAUD|nr:hypothetical protein PQD14_gp107 [Gordonia phage Chidiebere]QGJ92994.1 hypothetical protein PBI_CHIDIEBERE_107 [Gordonia phage Chidiebere]WAA20083.1 hypothetical protein SEA_HANEM_106 [Gordonia phage Hanem]